MKICLEPPPRLAGPSVGGLVSWLGKILRTETDTVIRGSSRMISGAASNEAGMPQKTNWLPKYVGKTVFSRQFSVISGWMHLRGT
jgi:hypothetical protein